MKKLNFLKTALIMAGVMVLGARSTTLEAGELQLGAHIGAVGISETSEIAYGLNMTTNPYGYAGFRLDLTFADVDGQRYFSSSPALALYVLDFVEMQLGFLGGVGFYKLPAAKTKFGLNLGMVGDFALSEQFSVGMESRFHQVFDSENVWSVFLTLAYKFQLKGAW